jgi:hypothetical protein
MLFGYLVNIIAGGVEITCHKFPNTNRAATGSNSFDHLLLPQPLQPHDEYLLSPIIDRNSSSIPSSYTLFSCVDFAGGSTAVT